MDSEFKKVTQTFQVQRKLGLWDTFLNKITGKHRSVVQEVEVTFLFNSDVDPEDVSVVLTGLYLAESDPVRKTIDAF